MSIQYKNWQSCIDLLVSKAHRRIWVIMQDQVRLDTNIYLPKKYSHPAPSILIRSPYPESKTLDEMVMYVSNFLEQGYAIVFQHERGRYWSEGSSGFLKNAKQDGLDTLDWIIKQDWSNGKVGTFGCSSSAENQLSLCTAAHPAHAAAIVMAPGAGIGSIGPYSEQGGIFRGGVLQLMFASWFRDYFIYGGQSGHLRPQFQKKLSHQDRLKVSAWFDLYASPFKSTSGKKLDYNSYFSHLPVCEINKSSGGFLTDWDVFSTRTPNCNEWKDVDFVNHGDIFKVPVLWVLSWHDISVAPSLAMYLEADATAEGRGEDEQHLIIGPLAHCQFGMETQKTSIGERYIGDARFDYSAKYLNWFNRFLKGTKKTIKEEYKVSYFQFGDNNWYHHKCVPTTLAKKTFYLQSQGAANTLSGDGLLTEDHPATHCFDSFCYNPSDPIPTLGGGACCMGGVVAAGSYDQTKIEERNDVLVYTSLPLNENLCVFGFLDVEVFVKSTAPDTDFTIKIIDVYPDGKSFNIDDTIFRMRYRNGYKNSFSLVKSDEVHSLKIPPLVIANTFRIGHRVRIEISSSNFPRYERNTNTGGENSKDSVYCEAVNSVVHGPNYRSKIVMPII